MIRSIIAGAVAMAVMSFGINAAPAIPQDQGEITFKGTVVDVPCGVEAQSARQEINFGQISKSFLQEGEKSQPRDLNIKPVNCGITSLKKTPVGGGATKAGAVALTFSSVSSGDNKDILQAVGATNTAIAVVDPRGRRVESDGTTTTGPSNLVDDGSTIHSTAAVRKDDSDNPVTKGALSAVASFNPTYQ